MKKTFRYLMVIYLLLNMVGLVKAASVSYYYYMNNYQNVYSVGGQTDEPASNPANYST